MPEKHGCGNTRVSQLICPLDHVTLEDCMACETRAFEKQIHIDTDCKTKETNADGTC